VASPEPMNVGVFRSCSMLARMDSMLVGSLPLSLSCSAMRSRSVACSLMIVLAASRWLRTVSSCSRRLLSLGMHRVHID